MLHVQLFFNDMVMFTFKDFLFILFLSHIENYFNFKKIEIILIENT